MGKCKKCGVEVPKEAMFCPNCGAGVSKEASVEKLSGGKGRRKKKYAMIGGGIGAILFILLVIFVSTRPKVIDLKNKHYRFQLRHSRLFQFSDIHLNLSLLVLYLQKLLKE